MLPIRKDIMPLFGAMGFVGAMLTTLGIRKMIWTPDVSWRPRSNPEPFNDKVDANGNTIGSKLYHSSERQHERSKNAPLTVYGVKAFPDERPPIEKMWADYRKKH